MSSGLWCLQCRNEIDSNQLRVLGFLGSLGCLGKCNRYSPAPAAYSRIVAMVSEDMVQSVGHRFDRDCRAHWPLELPTYRLVVAADCMAVAVTIAGFVAVAADTHLAMRRCNFDPVVEYYCRTG